MPDASLRRWVRRIRGDRPDPDPPQPDFDALAKTWDTLGSSDPLWAILTRPDARGGGWDVEEFFRDGQVQVDGALGLIADEIGWDLRRGAALDFGCGVGRLTQALCRRFERVDGVDIAPSMIEAAERFNSYGERCRYHLNTREDLAIFPDGTFDLVYSTYVLQHMHPVFAHRYVEEFVRLLAPGGLALFQMPTAARAPAANDPMPDAWFAAAHELLGAIPTHVPGGDPVPIRLRVTNRGPGVWPADGEGSVRLGARWFERNSALGVEARADLPRDMAPGDSEVLELHVPAPVRAGTYTLGCGLLQEGVAWFADRGGPLERAEVVVTPPTTDTEAEAPAERDEVPPMEMHATPVREVTAWVEAAGGRVIGTVDSAPDEHYDGVLYAVARVGAPPTA
jgi:SAM-dependent methyltransferase